MKNKTQKLSNYQTSKALFLAGLMVLIPVSVHASEISTDNILRLINSERESRSIQPLSIDSKLNEAASEKTLHMSENRYFDHYAYGLSPWFFIRSNGYDYDYAGENLAMNFDTSEGMVTAWMNSPLHRKNILNPEFEDIGVGIVKGESDQSKNITTNLFGKEKPSVMVWINNLTDKFIGLFR